jgi:hypothetical protein
VRYVWTSPEKIDPSGSAPTTSRSGFCDLRYLATPVIVPPVPTPATKAVMRPSVWRQISGPVVASWAAGFSSLKYWLGWNAPGISSVSRSATR